MHSAFAALAAAAMVGGYTALARMQRTPPDAAAFVIGLMAGALFVVSLTS